jgi:hypothetical protein
MLQDKATTVVHLTTIILIQQVAAVQAALVKAQPVPHQEPLDLDLPQA